MMQNIRLAIALNALHITGGLYAAGVAVVGGIKEPSASQVESPYDMPTSGMVAYIPYYCSEAAYMLITMNEGKADIHAMSKPKPTGTIDQEDYFLNWIGEQSTVSKLTPHESHRSFELHDGTTVYFVKVSKVDAKGAGKWMSSGELRNVDTKLSPDLKEVVDNKHWIDIGNSCGGNKAAMAKGKKGKKGKKK